MLYRLILCPDCHAPLDFTADGRRVCCQAQGGAALRGNFLLLDPSLGAAPPAEMLERDGDAAAYLSHRKFPTQIGRLKTFIRAHPPLGDGAKVLDLGCGPGPTTAFLLDAGYQTLAVDFSMRSLAINAQACGVASGRVLFAQADLNRMAFAPNSADGLMVADVLQHLGNQAVQAAFLRSSFAALKPGGWFYLSFFNTTLLHRLSGDLEGVRNGISYRRLSLAEVRGLLPESVEILETDVMNIFNDAVPDRLAAKLPFAAFLADMGVITGRRAR